MGFDGEIYSYIAREWQFPSLKMAGRFAAGLEIGDQLASFCILFILAGYLWQKPRLVKTFVGALVALAAGGIAVQALKYLIGRARPGLELGDFYFIGPHFSPGGYDSFPSGHTTAMFALLAFLSRYYPGWTVPAYVFGFLLSFLGRVITGQHFLTDIVGGAILGSVVGAIVAGRLRSLVESSRPQTEPATADGRSSEAPERSRDVDTRRAPKVAALGEIFVVIAYCIATLLIGPGEDFSAQLHTAFLGLLTALSVYFLARRLCGGKTGVYAALILSSSFLFVNVGRLLAADAAWLCFTAVAFTYYAYSVTRERKSNLLLALSYASIGLGLLAKGSPALFPVAVFLLHEYLAEKPPLRSFVLHNARRHALFLLLTVLAAAPWMGRGIFAGDATPDVFFDQMIAATGLTRHAGRVIYYLPVLVAAVFPWTFFAIAYFVREGKRWARETALDSDASLLVLWIAFVVALFPFTAAKFPHYIVMALPPLSCLLGGFLKREIAEASRALKFSLLATLAVAGAPVLAAAVFLPARPQFSALKFAVPFAVLTFFLALAWLSRNRRPWPGFFAAMCLGALGFYVSAIMIAIQT
jgi:membrane-associated phospholipid phosphatase